MEVLMECKLKIRKEIEELRKMWRDDKVVLEKRISKIEKKVMEKKGTEGLEGKGAEEVKGRVLSLEERMRMLEIGQSGNNEKKGKLKERTEWIGDDMTEYERKVEWIIKREAQKRKREGSQVKIEYKKMWVDKEFWIWDEMKDELRKWTEVKTREKEEEKDKKKIMVDKSNMSF
ncbi:uncharacterized protein [Cardiocondyla obscurior]|uniref:uncharacterized protein n=1 Tax=Cardiocondyla obscurior TaxID=286306 RepID=UPI0039656A80